MDAARLAAALDQGEDQAQRAFAAAPGWSAEAAAALALQRGRPRLALAWSRDPLIRAAAHLRLGAVAEARRELASLSDAARSTLLRARAGALAGELGAEALAVQARLLARQEGDAGALVAAATLLGELALPTDPRRSLRTLAEGLKVAELTGQEADAHLLAVLAHAQRALGAGPKAGRTAEKALARSAPRSPARVLALLACGQSAAAEAEAQAGELAPGWWRFTR
ncbi:hypothetical protein RDMS_13150 [Deinococcus sp. RL]|uniref:hypothetical protein n=1 Tax=Deinococcus sp. RL TaxID=1489678 RepID=UPI0004D77870|nr:hypothetical protein [Deinococcus sp. RL]KEF33286.1 hypothetical protein RDMS_13150 [Deinococcus sp. RL]